MPDAYDFWAGLLDRETMADVDGFWERFLPIAPRLDRAFRGEASDIDPAEATIASLGPLNEVGLFWEYGPGEGDGHMLVLTAELHHELRPLARAMVNRAPDIPGWSFADARPPAASAEHIVSLIEARSRMDYPLTALAPAPGEHRTIDFEGEGRGDAGVLQGVASLTFSVVFGEEIERDWLGDCHMTGRGALKGMFSRRSDPQDWLPEFSERTLAELQGLLDSRPEMPVHESGAAEWTLFSFEPQGDTDLPRSDMITYSTNQPKLADARFSGKRFASARFSRFGECFCGVRIPRTEAQSFDQVDDRSTLTEAIDAALTQDRTGGVIGDGHGTGHVYIDFATTDIDAAAARIEFVLNENGIAGPCDLIFDEAGLEELTLELTNFGRVQ